MRPEGVNGEPTEAEASVKATFPPGFPPGEGAAGAAGGAGAAAGDTEGPFTNLRLRSLRRGQLAGTCQGFSARWQMGQMPVPAMARSQRVLIVLMEKEDIHSKGFVHSFPFLSTATAEAPGPALRVCFGGSTSLNTLWYLTSATTESIVAASKAF